MEALFNAIEANLPKTSRGSSQKGTLPSVDPDGQLSASSGVSQSRNANGCPAASGTGSYRCHLCRRTYERGDHLNRHLKAHENTRPHKCSQCPKRFNRSDLLNRHETSHGRALGRKGDGSERVSVACLACVASKCKCQDQKPCARCQKKKIPCEVGLSQVQAGLRATRQGNKSQAGGSRHSTPGLTRDNESFGTTNQVTGSPELADSPVNGFRDDGGDRHGQMLDSQQSSIGAQSEYPMDSAGYGDSHIMSINNVPPAYNNIFQQYPFMSGEFQFNQSLGFIPRDSCFGQEVDFETWDVEHADFDLHLNANMEPVSASKLSSNEPAIDQIEAKENASKRYAAFERSPWLWSPTQKDHSLNDQTNLIVDEDKISLALTPNTPVTSLDQFSPCCIDSSMRDRILHLLFNLRVYHTPIRSFPPLSLLNLIIRVYFVQSRISVDHLIHSASFNPRTVLPELLLAIISAGATSISTPAIWRMGFVLQEIVRHTVAELWERNNSNTRNLQTLQAWVIALDIALWSGIKRKMEIAESVCQPVIIMLRRMGALSAGKGPVIPVPALEDSDDMLVAKWERFVEHESFKRLVLHLFIHDTQASVGFQKPPQISFTEIQVDLPVSRDLWLAESASQWRDIYLEKLKKQSTTVPTFMEVMHHPEALQQVASQVDIKFCAMVVLQGYWGQIWRLMEARKFYPNARAAYRLSLMTEHDELYRDLVAAATKLSSSCRNEPTITLLGEFFLMISHVSPEDLQRFAGKYGADESRIVSDDFQTWFQTSDSRMAIWHAGQVLRAGKYLMPTQLRDFYAVAVYYASLTLWVYGAMLRSRGGDRARREVPHTPPSNDSFDSHAQICLNEEETVYLNTFRVSNEGIAGLAMLDGEQNREFVPIYSTDRILGYGRWIYRNNFSFTDEPLPPLLESLGNLMRDLSSSPGSSASRTASEAPE